ncbi:type I-B CRISPR-associated protein Cas7/Csh2 [Haladaptatus sp. R4]|uniref:type I-B CRISPR-associated protein Cas7/Csh2 n=1 Tax=Haladaptatus sp. R4 TaxID=1679489 RepID=UPI0007B489E0|nr:type I-B CRISPR-associated protein Cas7/Csh2 [Haladaptatus sp. R4]KZN24964.1 type I-B CRISPR-associated protein Cas7/Csh2 [Haladaptatus sp. R4]
MTDIQNRSEILFITDAQDCNPNGNPMGENRPRIDPITQKAAITDVRLKRYLRDQLHDDDHPIFVKKTGEKSAVRAALALDLFDEVEKPEDLDQIDDIRTEFLERATDVRYFGATLSFNKDPEDDLYAAVKEHFSGGNFTGPVQFSPARSLNEVETNEETSTLTSVIATQEGNEQGGFDLDDHRIKYGIFPFHGLVDEHGADDTRLSRRDVKRLDTLCWRALKNQTISRSKVGQEPRLYLRVEYATDGYHVGDLHNDVSLANDSDSTADAELRSVRDVRLNVTNLVETLTRVAEAGHIEEIHYAASERLQATCEGEDIETVMDVPDVLSERGVPVHEIDVYEEFKETLPSE